jgi:hypothetical protein
LFFVFFYKSNEAYQKNIKFYWGKKVNLDFYLFFRDLLKKEITDEIIEERLYGYIDLISEFTEVDFKEICNNPKFKNVDKYLIELQENLKKENLNFISKINVTEFSNIIKLFYLLKETQIQNLFIEEHEFLIKIPHIKKLLGLSVFRELYENKIKELLPQHEINILGLEDEDDKLIEFKQKTFELLSQINPDAILILLNG